jgi:hypothetical protein
MGLAERPKAISATRRQVTRLTKRRLPDGRLSKETAPPGDSGQTDATGQAEAATQTKKHGHSKKADTWTLIEKSFQRTLHQAEVAYRTNYMLNLIIVALGIILVASSLVFAWARGLNPDTLTFAGLGIADFTAVFLVNPQFRIQQLLGDWEQIQVIYRTWYDQSNLVDFFTVDADGNYKIFDFDQVTAVNEEMAKISQQALSAIEMYVGAPSKSSSSDDDGKGQNPPKPPQTKQGNSGS